MILSQQRVCSGVSFLGNEFTITFRIDKVDIRYVACGMNAVGNNQSYMCTAVSEGRDCPLTRVIFMSVLEKC